MRSVASRQTSLHVQVVGASIAFASIFGSGPAYAADTAAAQALFADARKLMNDGKFAEACPKLEESENLDPGMGTMYNLGDCYEHLGRTASAWASFDEVANEAHAASQPAREQDARARATKLLPALAHITIDASAVQTVSGLEIARDGTSVGAAQWGLSIPIDPGPHTIIARANGKKEWSSKITIAAQETKRVAVPMLEDAPVAVVPPNGDTATSGQDGAPQSDGKSQRTLGLALAGVGVVSLGVGVVFTFISKGEESKANDGDCNSSSNICKTQNGVDMRHTAIVEGNISTVGFIAGLILAGGGITLWATAPKAHPATTGKWNVTPDVAFGQSGASLGMRGRF